MIALATVLICRRLILFDVAACKVELRAGYVSLDRPPYVDEVVPVFVKHYF